MERLTPEQASRISQHQRTVADKQVITEAAALDHGLRKWCVDMAIKAMGQNGAAYVTDDIEQNEILRSSLPKFGVPLLSREIYDFVNEPFTKKDGAE
jgi:hypothetical protein